MTTLISLPGRPAEAAAFDEKEQRFAPSAFTTAASISAFQISPAEFLASRPDIHNIIVRRAASDSFPLKWEIAAGTADPNVDRSIVGVAVRELWEETQLRARRLHAAVGLGLPPNTTNLTLAGEVQDARMDTEYPLCLIRLAGLTWAVATFLTDIEDEGAEIVLREDEHEDWAWLTEEEVEKGCFNTRAGESLDMVSEAARMIVLEGFRLIKEASVDGTNVK